MKPATLETCLSRRDGGVSAAPLRRLLSLVAAIAMIAAMGVGAISPAGAESPPALERIERGPAGVDGEIERLYVALLDRAPEEEGLEYWVGRRADGMALTEMVAFFRTSPEFQQTFGTQVNATTEEWVEFMYVEVLERPSEQSGKDFWVERVESGDATKEDLIVFFADSVEFRVKTGTGMEGLMALVDASEAVYAPEDSYQYERSTSSIIGGSTTTITVTNGVVTERAYEESILNDAGDYIDDSWVETGDEIGSHDGAAEALTVIELHQACREYLVELDEDPLYSLTVQVDDNGFMNRCGGDFLQYIADAGTGDYITIENYTIVVTP